MDPSYNNSFGTQPPVSSGTGDIVLQPDKPAKSKKGIFIGIGVLLVLLVVALIAFLATGGGKGSEGSSGSSNDNVSVETAFNRYANYLVSGEVKDSEVTIDDDTVFSFTESYTDDAVLKKATELYGAFYNKAISNEDLVINSSLSLEKGEQYYQLLNERKTIEIIDTDTLYYKYVDSGSGAALNYAKEFYNIDESKTDVVSIYRSDLYDWAKTKIDFWVIYDKYGCIKNKEYDNACINNIPLEVTEEVSTRLGDISVYFDNLNNSIVDGLTRQCREISKLLKTEKNGE